MATNVYQPNSTNCRDTSISGTSATNNYGDATSATIGTDSVKGSYPLFVGIFQFDISDITAGSTITSAKLTLYCNAVLTGGWTDGKVSRLIRSDWVETEVTWNIYKTSNNWTTAGAASDGNDYSSTNEVTWTAPTGTGDFDITGLGTLAQDAIDSRSGIFRVKLWRPGGVALNVIAVNTGEIADSTAPRLTVVYTAASTKILMSSLGVG